MNKEQIYDEKLAPLMTQVIDLCREHKIAMLATFCIPNDEDSTLSCTTHLPDETGALPAHIKAAAQIIRPRAMMLTTKNTAGEVTSMTAVLP